jgi:PBSX family phage portal protein
MKSKIKKEATAEIIHSISKESLQLQDEQKLALYVAPPYDFATLAEIYTYNGYHTKCINLKASLSVALGYEITRDDITSPMQEDSDYSKLKDFFDNHIKYAGQSFSETLMAIQTDYEIYGNAYIEIIRNLSGEIVELYHLPARDILLQYNHEMKKCFAVQSVSSINTVTFAPFGDYKYAANHNMSEYLHIKNYNPESRFYGMPEYVGTIASILLDRNAAEYNINKFNNNAVPETIVTIIGARFDKNAKEKIGEFFRQNVKGVENAGRSLILEIEDETSKIEVKPIGSEIKEASFRFLRLDVRDEIIAAHGVPKRLLNVTENVSWNNSTESKNQLKIFQECIIQPRQNKMEDIINRFIIKEGLGIDKWKLKLNKLYVEDAKSDADYYTKLYNIGVLTQSEIRSELGYDPFPS